MAYSDRYHRLFPTPLLAFGVWDRGGGVELERFDGDEMTILTNPEREIENEIITWMTLLGAVGGRTHVTASQTLSGRFLKDKNRFKGVPDLTYFYKNRLWFIEVKCPGGRQSAEQKVFEKLCKACSVEYLLVMCVDDVLERMTGSCFIEKDAEWEKWKRNNLC